MQRFNGKITKETIKGTSPLFVGDIYEDDIWEFANARTNPIQYIHAREPKACVELNGSFLFLEPNGDVVYIGTDQNSVYPLYYTVHNKDLYYSWNVDELVKLLPYKPDINWDNIIGWLVSGPVYFSNETRLKGVYRLEAGSYIEYNGEEVKIYRSEPFRYNPDYNLSFDECVYRLVYSLGKAIKRRLRPNDDKTILFGLSGGIDSRIVLSELVKQTKNVTTYTYGEDTFVEKVIAKQVAELLGVKWVNITIDKWAYLDCMYDEAEMSGGMSLFKHAPQFYFSLGLQQYNPYGLVLGSALDLLIGNSYPTFDIGLAGANSVMFDSLVFKYNKDHIREYQEVILDGIGGGNYFDISCAYHIETRVKHWYNWNLIYHLRNHKLLLPTYDKDFLNVVSSIPLRFRKDDNVRIALLKALNYEASKIIYNATMQPAYVENPMLDRFIKSQEIRRDTLLKVWLKQGIYLPSNDYDFNFLEWSRVYPRYRDMVEELLFNDDSFMEEKINGSRLWNDHLQGKANYHKELIMLISTELFCRHYYGEMPYGQD